jgi:hypothetical protein
MTFRSTGLLAVFWAMIHFAVQCHVIVSSKSAAVFVSLHPLSMTHTKLMQIHCGLVREYVAVAVPVGVSAFDECTCATKACTCAKTYLSIKPDKYGIHFYAVVGHRYCYMSSFFNNRASNNTVISGPTEYHLIFRDMRTPYYKTIEEDESMRDSPSALWLLMMGHQTKTYKLFDGKKHIFMLIILTLGTT